MHSPNEWCLILHLSTLEVLTEFKAVFHQLSLALMIWSTINCVSCQSKKNQKSHFPANCRQSAITQRVHHKVWGKYSSSHQFRWVDSWAQNTLHTWKVSPEHFLWQKLYEFRTCLQNSYRVGYSYIPNPFLTTPNRKTTKQNKHRTTTTEWEGRQSRLKDQKSILANALSRNSILCWYVLVRTVKQTDSLQNSTCFIYNMTENKYLLRGKYFLYF